MNKQISRTTTLASTHRLILGDLTTPILIRLELDEDNGQISTEVSHALQPPDQNHAYVPEVLMGYYPTLEAGIESVVAGYKAFYVQATEAGLTPEESWLVPAPQ